MATAIKITETPDFNPLRDIAARLRYLSENWEKLTDAAGEGQANAIDREIGDERDQLLNQASFFDAVTPADAMVLLMSIHHGMDALIGDLEHEATVASPGRRRAFEWLIRRSKSAYRATYLLANWIEITHGIDRKEVVGADCIPTTTSPFRDQD